MGARWVGKKEQHMEINYSSWGEESNGIGYEERRVERMKYRVWETLRIHERETFTWSVVDENRGEWKGVKSRGLQQNGEETEVECSRGK